MGTLPPAWVSPWLLESVHCAQGSLEDLLHNEALQLDWTFKAALLLDLIHVINPAPGYHSPEAVGEMGRGGRQDAQTSQTWAVLTLRKV